MKRYLEVNKWSLKQWKMNWLLEGFLRKFRWKNQYHQRIVKQDLNWWILCKCKMFKANKSHLSLLLNKLSYTDKIPTSNINWNHLKVWTKACKWKLRSWRRISWIWRTKSQGLVLRTELIILRFKLNHQLKWIP